MNEEQRLVYVRGMLLAAEIEMQAMIAENKMREIRGESPAYGEEQFQSLIKEYGVSHNALITDIMG